MAKRRKIEIHVPALARVEGEGALDIKISKGRIQELKLRIYEPPRLFERNRLVPSLDRVASGPCGGG